MALTVTYMCLLVVLLRCFINKVLKCKACYHFISPEQLIGWRASFVFIEGCIYRRNLPVTGGVEGGNGEAHTSPNVEKWLGAYTYECSAIAKLDKLL